jgi:hypothetical protein
MGRPYGSYEGRPQWENQGDLNFCRMYAKEVTKIMVEQGHLPEDPKVEKAFEVAMEILASQINAATRLSAARLVLDFTKAKPTAKSEVTVKSAEDWIQEVTSDYYANKADESVSD